MKTKKVMALMLSTLLAGGTLTGCVDSEPDTPRPHVEGYEDENWYWDEDDERWEYDDNNGSFYYLGGRVFRNVSSGLKVKSSKSTKSSGFGSSSKGFFGG